MAFNEEKPTIHSRRTSKLYGVAGFAPVCALLFLVSCAHAPPAPPAPRDGGFESPEHALQAFTVAWNSEDSVRLLDTFLPSRRATIRASQETILAQFAGLRIENAAVLPQCHPRGGDWKTAVLEVGIRRADPRSAARKKEIVWLRLQNGAWWMYSL